MPPGVAWISRGKLFVKPAGGEVREVDSAFARQVVERRLRAQQVDGWKGRSGLWANWGMEPPGVAPWMQLEQQRSVTFGCVARGDGDGEVFYVLNLDTMSGLFRYDLARDEELRLMHRNDLAARDLSRHPGSGTVALSVARSDGTVGIVVGENDGRFLRDVTLGDSIDEAPAWVPGDGRRIVYQSAGIGRNEHGLAVGMSPYAVALLDLDRQSVETLVEDEARDCLQPRMTADGALHFIRRPYRPWGPRPGAWAQLKDVLLFPFRLGRAFVHFFNAFSMMFSGKPLLTAGGPQRPQGDDTKYLRLWGQWVDAQQALKQAGRKGGPEHLVPKDWQLVRMRPAVSGSGPAPFGDEEVLAEHVLCYDVGAGGSIVLTNGTTIEHVGPDGRREPLCRDHLIERVIALSSP